ncbi:MAG: hypothetical protein GF355_00520 [Candidatus Eisenbacteria bacterium]|nr:hypothetical protein [Candidatus Eisenbacteria bacterium]
MGLRNPSGRAALILAVVALGTLCSTTPSRGEESATAFTYQGQLREGDTPVDAEGAQFIFRLWDAESGGSQIGSDWIASPVAVKDGVFTALVDFGGAAFDGEPRWLEIGVDVSGGTDYEWLAPRQRLTASPVALHALTGGDNPWNISGNDISYNSGDVGIGTLSPAVPLHVEGSGPDPTLLSVANDHQASGTAIHGRLDPSAGVAVHGEATSNDGEVLGVYGEVTSRYGIGVKGESHGTTGSPAGVAGYANAPHGYGAVGLNEATTGLAVGVLGRSLSSEGFGGYFIGNGYFSNQLGIGTSSPQAALDVDGTARMTGFQLATGPQAGYVLTADASGNGSWQPAGTTGGYWQPGTGADIYYNAGNVGIGSSSPAYPLQVGGTAKTAALITGGFKLETGPSTGYVLTCDDAGGNASWQAASADLDLPYQGSASTYGSAFKVTNTSTSGGSHAIHGVINNASSSTDAAAGYFSALGSNGHAVLAHNDHGHTILAQNMGTIGYAVCADGLDAQGGISATSSRSDGVGIYAKATGTYGNALHAESTAGGAAAVLENTHPTAGVGVIARGSSQAARFYGNVAIYEHGTTNKVIELGKGLDYAEGFDIAGGSGAPVEPGCVVVIDPRRPGRLTPCRRAYDRKVAGIVAGARGLGSGVRLGAGEFDHDVALAGRVYCNAVALGDDIEPGDLLTTSDRPGYAMEVVDHARAQGAVLGKAMEPLAKGETGQILVLVTLQ